MEIVLPAIVSAEPSSRLVIVGRNPPRWLISKIDRNPNVELHANVPDVRPYMQRAGMMVVPLRIGGGSRLKILEAAACGLPVVSTCVGAEGLSFESGRHYLAAESIPKMAKPILKAIRNYSQLQPMQVAARKQVELYYDWDALAQQLDEVWRKCAAKTAKRSPLAVQ